MDRRFKSLLLSLAPLACGQPSLGPPPENHTSPILTVGGGDELDDQSSADDTNDTADTNDMPGCDPFVDPEDECGVGMDCDPEFQVCVAATGPLLIGESCDVEGVGDQCAAGLTCAEGRCRSVCNPAGDLLDPEAPGSCPSTDVCTLVESDWGICLRGCSLVGQDCPAAGEACNRAQGAHAIVAACTRNPGSGAEADPCGNDRDCLGGLLCTAAALHTTECNMMAASCCAFICDNELLACAGIEPSCYALGIVDQPNAGYCGPF